MFFWRWPEKNFEDLFLFSFGERLKKIFEDRFFLFGEYLRLCSLALAPRGSVLGRAVRGLGLGFFCAFGLGLEPCVLDYTCGKDLIGKAFSSITLPARANH